MSLLLETSSSINPDRELLAVVLSLREIFNVLEVSEGPGE